MKPIIMFLTVILLAACSKPIIVPEEIRGPIQLLMDFENEYQDDNEWRKNNTSRLFHPDANWLGGSMIYDTKYEYQSIESGTYVFKRSQVIDVQKKIENIYWPNGRIYKEKAEYYVGKIIYTITGKIVKDKQIKEQGKQILLLIFLKDDSDDQFKLFDQLPNNYLNYYGEGIKDKVDINEIRKND